MLIVQIKVRNVFGKYMLACYNPVSVDKVDEQLDKFLAKSAITTVSVVQTPTLTEDPVKIRELNTTQCVAEWVGKPN